MKGTWIVPRGFVDHIILLDVACLPDNAWELTLYCYQYTSICLMIIYITHSTSFSHSNKIWNTYFYFKTSRSVVPYALLYQLNSVMRHYSYVTNSLYLMFSRHIHYRIYDDKVPIDARKPSNDFKLKHNLYSYICAITTLFDD